MLLNHKFIQDNFQQDFYKLNYQNLIKSYNFNIPISNINDKIYFMYNIMGMEF